MTIVFVVGGLASCSHSEVLNESAFTAKEKDVKSAFAPEKQADKQGFETVSFLFSVINKSNKDEIGSNPSVNEGASSSLSLSELEDGSVISTKDLLKLELSAQKSAQLPKRTSPYNDVVLIANYENIDSGEVGTRPIQRCANLSFNSDDTVTFDQTVTCDNTTYHFDTGKNGIDIYANNKVSTTLVLDPGVYVLNGLPFTVSATN